MKIKLPRKKKKKVKKIIEKELHIDHLNQKKIGFQNILFDQYKNLETAGFNITFRIKF